MCVCVCVCVQWPQIFVFIDSIVQICKIIHQSTVTFATCLYLKVNKHLELLKTSTNTKKKKKKKKEEPQTY